MTDNPTVTRQKFKIFNRLMLLLWKLGLGPYINAWPEVGGRIMVLNHHGRRSGKRLQTPLNFAEVNGEIYCAAGFGPDSDWYKNIIVNPQVEIWLPDGWWAGLAEEVLDPHLRPSLMRSVLLSSGVAAPFFGIPLKKMTDDQIMEATENYNLIRIRRTTARTGPGGPGDLAGIWPLTTLILLWMLLTRKKAKRCRK